MGQGPGGEVARPDPTDGGTRKMNPVRLCASEARYIFSIQVTRAQAACEVCPTL